MTSIDTGTFGRETDAAPSWIFFTTPTPGLPNEIVNSIDFLQTIEVDPVVYPSPYRHQFTLYNPFEQELHIQMHDISGKLLSSNAVDGNQSIVI